MRTINIAMTVTVTLCVGCVYWFSLFSQKRLPNLVTVIVNRGSHVILINGGVILVLVHNVQRSEILVKLAELIDMRRQQIVFFNKKDLNESDKLSSSLKSRLKITDSKLDSLISGMKLVAISELHFTLSIIIIIL